MRGSQQFLRMEFDRKDVRQLYGRYLFILPETESKSIQSSIVEEAQSNLFVEGEAISWKLKPQAQIVFVLTKEEFSNKKLTELLKVWVLSAEISTAHIGFGIFPGAAKAIRLVDLPVDLAVVFGPPESPGKSSLQLGEKDIFVLPAISELSQKGEGNTQAINTLEKAKFLMNPV